MTFRNGYLITETDKLLGRTFRLRASLPDIRVVRRDNAFVTVKAIGPGTHGAKSFRYTTAEWNSLLRVLKEC